MKSAGLDLIRWIALLLIVQVHITMHPIEELAQGVSGLRAFSLHFWIAIDLFLFLSGFLFAKQVGSQEPPWRYFLRRCLRLAPAYFLVLFLMSRFYDRSWDQIFWQELALFTNFPYSVQYLLPWTWYLAVEFQFALFALPLLYLLRAWGSKKALIYLLGLAGLAGLIKLGIYWVRAPLNHDEFIQSFYVPFFARVDSLFYGAALGLMLRSKVALPGKKFWLLCSPLIYLVALRFWDLGVSHQLFSEGFLFDILLMNPLLPLANAGLVLLVVNREFWWPGLLRVLSELSYGVFLVHIPVYMLFVRRIFPASESGLQWLMALIATLLISYLVSALIYWGFEKPITLRFLDRRNPSAK